MVYFADANQPPIPNENFDEPVVVPISFVREELSETEQQLIEHGLVHPVVNLAWINQWNDGVEDPFAMRYRMIFGSEEGSDSLSEETATP